MKVEIREDGGPQSSCKTRSRARAAFGSEGVLYSGLRYQPLFLAVPLYLIANRQASMNPHIA